MCLMSFKYTKTLKTHDEVSNRVAVVLAEPAENYFTIDVSDLDIEDQALIAVEVEQANLDRNVRISEIMEKYDVRTNFRSFSPSKMSEIKDD